MRLTCPKCNARYEVAQAAIPASGRDVQCSGCGHTWFQTHPDHPDASGPAPEPAAAPGGADAAPEHVHRELDPAVADILRQEAERETRLRARERETGLESQPELGLDFAAAAAARRAEPRPQDRAQPDTGNLNAPLRARAEVYVQAERPLPPPGAESAPPGSSAGFLTGFGLVAVSALALLLLYASAGQIASSMPQFAPAMEFYVAKVDRGRVWLDGAVGSYIPNE